MIERATVQRTAKGNGKGVVLETMPAISSFRFSDRSAAIRIFLTCWLVFTLHFATNTVREIFPALTLGDHLSFDVSEYNGLHTDTFELPGRGSFINNNPGASMIGAIPYTLFRPITDRIIDGVQRSRAENPQAKSQEYDSIYPMAREFYRNAREKGFDIKLGIGAGITQAFAMAPISALGVVVMFWILLALTNNTRTSVLLSLVYAFATPIFFRTAQLNQNALLASFTLFAFALLWRPWKKVDPSSKPFYFLAGLCAGWTVVLDYSGLVAVVTLSLYALSRWLSEPRDKRQYGDLVTYASGVAICALVLMAYQWSSFGNPFLPAQSYMPSVAYTELGYKGFSFPRFDLLAETAFNIRYGLFTSAPILLLALIVPVWLRKKSRLLERRELVFVVSFIALFFVFCAANQYGRMQFYLGVRHIVPVVPFMFLLAANVLLQMPRILAVFFGTFATYWSWCLVMYRDVEFGLGIFDAVKNVTLEGFRLPWLLTLDRMGYVQNSTAIPLMMLCAAAILILWSVGRRQETGIPN
ncbi:MAG: hypothetical protein WBD27_06630 [Pyrinomonadaceae bacterium]